MSTILKLVKQADGILAVNAVSTIHILLEPTHYSSRLFGKDKDTVFVKAVVRNNTVKILNPCKPWKEWAEHKEVSNGQA